MFSTELLCKGRETVALSVKMYYYNIKLLTGINVLTCCDIHAKLSLFWITCYQSNPKNIIYSAECSICPIAVKAVTLRLPTAAVSGHIDVYYAEKVAHYSRSLCPKSRSKRPDSRGFWDIKGRMCQGHDLDLSGHVMSSITWPFNSHYMISYRCCNGIDTLISKRFRDVKAQMYQGHNLDLSWSRDVTTTSLFPAVLCYSNATHRLFRRSVSLAVNFQPVL